MFIRAPIEHDAPLQLKLTLRSKLSKVIQILNKTTLRLNSFTNCMGWQILMLIQMRPNHDVVDKSSTIPKPTPK
jgi:hypothetical protein